MVISRSTRQPGQHSSGSPPDDSAAPYGAEHEHAMPTNGASAPQVLTPTFNFRSAEEELPWQDSTLACFRLDPVHGGACLALPLHRSAGINVLVATFDHQRQPYTDHWCQQLQRKCAVSSRIGERYEIDGEEVELIRIQLNSMPLCVHHVLIALSIPHSNSLPHDNQSCCIRVLQGECGDVQQAVCKCVLPEAHGVNMILGLLTRRGAHSSFMPIGDYVSHRTVSHLQTIDRCTEYLESVESVAPVIYTIKICVMRGNGLAAKDRRSFFSRATSDPYYIVNFKKTSYTSEHRSRTLDPQWEDHNFELGRIMETDTNVIKITLFDYDTISKDDYMGEVQIAANELYSLGLGVHERSYNVSVSKEKAFKDEYVCGTIQLRIQIT